MPLTVSKIFVRALSAGFVIAFPALNFHCTNYYLQMAVLLLGFALSIGILFRRLGRFAAILRGGGAILALIWLILIAVGHNSHYLMPSCYVSDAPYANSGFHGRVLILVPHQDDEINLMGGVLEALVKNCDVWVVYTTNGTARGKCVRPQEACNALEKFGIKQQNVIFLGFDQTPWNAKIQHMYNAPPNKVILSEYGRNETWLPNGFVCYSPHQAYTQANFEGEIASILKEIMPDFIFITDYDTHPDHRALGLSTMKAMSHVLRDNPMYHPSVFTGFAYSGCWGQDPDFYESMNIGSTAKLGSQRMEEVNCYLWEERLRLPVGKGSITRTISGNLTAEAFKEHYSQRNSISRIPERICNGDRVFWWHPTNNLALFAHVTCDGENVEDLNDCMLYDSDDIADSCRKPFDHGWRPEGEKGVLHFSWDTPVVIREIHLFDHPDENNQIKALQIKLSNGKIIRVPALPRYGNRYVVDTMCDEPIDGFSITIEDSTGTGSGLSEVEAYSSSPSSALRIAKFQDSEGNFMYDYITREDGNLQFSIYTWNCTTADIHVTIREANTKVALKKDGEMYCLRVPVGESCVLESLYNNCVMDEVKVSNPSFCVRIWYRFVRKLDHYVDFISWRNQDRYYSWLWKWIVSFFN